MKSTVDKYERKLVEIKAIGEEDLVIIRKEDFEKLSREDQEKFKDVDE
jgi:hypothetical protein